MELLQTIDGYSSNKQIMSLELLQTIDGQSSNKQIICLILNLSQNLSFPCREDTPDCATNQSDAPKHTISVSDSCCDMGAVYPTVPVRHTPKDNYIAVGTMRCSIQSNVLQLYSRNLLFYQLSGEPMPHTQRSTSLYATAIRFFFGAWDIQS